MDLYKCETLAQFKIGVWLAENGIERANVAGAELLAPNSVRITNHAGQYMDIVWRNDAPEII